MTLKIIKRTPDPANSVRVGSVRTFLEQLEARRPETEDHFLLFRGHSSFTYQLVPSIYRNSGWIENEDILFKELLLRCPSDFERGSSTFETLVKMQHYSLPTRLLDVTANPLVALYFACQVDATKPFDSGEVVIFRIPKRDIKYFDSDTVSVVANLSRRPKTFIVPAASELTDFNNVPEIRLLLHEIKAEKPYFEGKIQRDHLSAVVCVKPKHSNARIIRQDGAFLLFGVDGAKTQAAKVPEAYLPTGQRVVIKSIDKNRVLEQLRALGITHGTLFPEIERVATHIKSTYFRNPVKNP